MSSRLTPLLDRSDPKLSQFPGRPVAPASAGFGDDARQRAADIGRVQLGAYRGREGEIGVLPVLACCVSVPGLQASVGTVADAYDNALVEYTIGLFKTELTKPGGPWRTCDQVEIATLEYVDWYNHRRRHSGAADLSPADFETLHQSQPI